MAARYATSSFWFHNVTSGHDEFVHLGALRDTTTAVVTQYPAMFSVSALTVTTAGGLDPKLGEYLKVHGGGPGE
jgi:hypothetical protein